MQFRPTPATPDHRDSAARLDLSCVEGGAQPGGYPAADQGQLLNGHIVPDFNRGVLMHQHLLSKGRNVGELVDRGISLP